MKKLYFFLGYIFVAIPALLAQTFPGKLGYALSPVGHPYDYSQMGPFLQEVANTCNGGVVLANGNWRDNLNTSGQIPVLQRTVCNLQPSPFGYVDMPVYAWATYPTQFYLDSPSDTTRKWSNASMKNLFLQTLIRTADSLQPTYLFLGNEVNFYIGIDSLDYSNWAAFYSMAYDSVKAHSPNTKMGTVFNYDHMAGKGTSVGWTSAHWNALYNMDTSRMDVIGVTFYPFLEYNTANSIPVNDLDPLFNKIGNIPVVLTETGWPGDSLIGAWSASPQQQIDYVQKLFSVVSGKNVEAVNWLYLNYLMDTTNAPEILIYKSIAMRDSLGNDRPALPVWLSYCSSMSQFELDQSSIHVFPNPSAGELHIELEENKGSCVFTLMDPLGQVVYNTTLSSSAQVELVQPKGIYFYTLERSGRSVARGKILIE